MKSNGKVIFIDDEKHVRLAREQTLRLANYEVTCLASAEEALRILTPEWGGALVCDIKMPGMDGMTLLRKAMEIDPEIPVALVTGHGDVSMAVEAMRAGAYDFLEKPCPTDVFLDVVKRAVEKRRLVMENRELRSRLDPQCEPLSRIQGRSPAVERLRTAINSIAQTDVDVLVRGETGTGKELAARCLHDQSRRRDGRFVAVNCGALPESIIESELFGHEAGAFTGAHSRRVGKFEYADKGTIFLDEVESMPYPSQVKLLRVLQERTVERLGSNEPVPLDIRVVAATKSDLKEISSAGRFRDDLYYRLNVATLYLPPLRERKEDIPLLFQSFVLEACSRYRCRPPELSRDTIQDLLSRKWEGNVRELKNEVERFVLNRQFQMDLSGGPTAEVFNLRSKDAQSMPLSRQVNEFEKALIEQELIRQKGDIKKTHAALGLPRQTLYDKMNKYGLKRTDYV
ncbi:MAG: sigma-54-dependent Fis family transcriptional regulator [Nitrospinae bacterium]|nr:sigma-54-dependent Fis family transcriptional regulator [Nitrospinota bacterium]